MTPDRPAARARAAGRARTQSQLIRAEPRKVAASASSEVRMPSRPAIAPPTAYPTTCENWRVVMDLRVERRPGRGERRADQRHQEQRCHLGRERQPRQHHDHHQPGPDQVAADHRRPAGEPVGQARQREPAHEQGHAAGGEGDGGQQRRVGLPVDQQGESDPGELVADDGQQLRDPQRPELGHREDLAERAHRESSLKPDGRPLVSAGRRPSGPSLALGLVPVGVLHGVLPPAARVADGAAGAIDLQVTSRRWHFDGFLLARAERRGSPGPGAPEVRRRRRYR